MPQQKQQSTIMRILALNIDDPPPPLILFLKLCNYKTMNYRFESSLSLQLVAVESLPQWGHEYSSQRSNNTLKVGHNEYICIDIVLIWCILCWAFHSSTEATL